MSVAIILLKAEAQEINKIAATLAAIPGVTEVYSVAGHYDLVAIARVKSNEMLAELVTERIRGVPGIEESQTLIAFRAYSKHDLESLFGVN